MVMYTLVEICFFCWMFLRVMSFEGFEVVFRIFEGFEGFTIVIVIII